MESDGGYELEAYPARDGLTMLIEKLNIITALKK